MFFIIDKYDTTNNALRNFLKQQGAEVIDDGRIPSQIPQFYPTQIFILDASKIAAITRAVQVSPEILTTLARGQDTTPYSSSITQADRLETRGAKRLLDFQA